MNEKQAALRQLGWDESLLVAFSDEGPQLLQEADQGDFTDAYVVEPCIDVTTFVVG